MAHAPETAVMGNAPFVYVDTEVDFCAYAHHTRAKNLILYSEKFDVGSAWTETGTSLVTSSNSLAPDGTQTAYLLDDNDGAGNELVGQAITIAQGSDRYYFSLYVKAGTATETQVTLTLTGGTPATTDVVVTWATMAVSGTGAFIEYICDGWYRLSGYVDNDGSANTTATYNIYPAGSTAADTGTVYVWGATTNKDESLGHYIKTVGVAKEAGCYAFGENLLTQSEDFSHADWTDPSAQWTVVADSQSGPDNDTDADVITVTGTTALVRQIVTPPTTSTFSIWFKVVSGTFTDIDIDSGDGTAIAIEDQLVADRWIRCTASGLAKGASAWLDITFTTSLAGAEIAVWGAQLNEGLVAVAYQETTTAAIARTNSAAFVSGEECHNTYNTCHKKANYTKSCKTYRYCKGHADLPIFDGASMGVPFFPFLRTDPSFTSTKIIPGNGTSIRGAVTLTFNDAKHHDRGIDPYYAVRTHDTNQGTYWGKWLARNRHYHRRKVKVYSGYITDPFDSDNFEKRSYIVENIHGPDLDGRVTWQCKDILAKTDDKSKIPVPTDGVLTAVMTDSQLTADIAKHEGEQYDRTGSIKIGSEILDYTHVGHNMYTKSEEFDHSDWVKSGLTSVASAVNTDPFGGANSYLVTEDSSTGQHLLYQSPAIVDGDQYVMSAYFQAHPSGSGFLNVTIWGQSNVLFNIADGVLYSDESGTDYTNASIEDVGDDWYRVSVTFTKDNSTAGMYFGCADATPTHSYTGTGNPQYYVWAADAYDGAVLGNYYKTDTTAFTANDRFTIASTAERGSFGSIASAHAIDDTVQLCYTQIDENIVDTVYDVLVTRGTIPEYYVPYDPDAPHLDDWGVERLTWLDSFNTTFCIPDPIDSKKLINELAIASMINLWVDEVNEKIKLTSITPPEANAIVVEIDTTSNIVKDSLTIQRDEKRRLTRVVVIFDKINQAEGDDPDNYNLIYIQANPANEQDYAYGEPSIKKIRTRILGEDNLGQAAQLGGRYLARFSDAPLVAKFKLHAKDHDIMTGDLVRLASNGIQDRFGAYSSVLFEVTEKREVKLAEMFEYTCLESRFTGLYGYIGPDTLVDYASESDANKQAYAFISNDDEEMSDGDPAYKII